MHPSCIDVEAEHTQTHTLGDADARTDKPTHKQAVCQKECVLPECGERRKRVKKRAISSKAAREIIHNTPALVGLGR